MSKFKELRTSRVGLRFGSLVLLEYLSRDEGYLCLCDCGHKQKLKFYKVKHMSKCKKCPRVSKGRPISADPFVPHRATYHRYKQSAKRRTIKFELSEQEVFDLIIQNCSYCDLPPSTDMKLSAHPDFRYTGIDRVDNDKGYEKDNVVPCCETCNTSKRTMSLAQWRAWIARVHKKLNSVELNQEYWT